MKKILIIEDDNLVRIILAKVLLAEKFEVITAENGLIGLHHAIELEPDLIISDMNMPYMNGEKVLIELRANWKTAKIPFIFLTSEDGNAIRTRAFKLGANDYLIKPFKTQKLLQAIATQFSQNKFCSINSEISA